MFIPEPFFHHQKRCYVFFCALLPVVFITLSSPATAADYDDGTLVLSKKDEVSSCTIPFKSGTYDFTSDGGGYGCENDDMYSIALNNVPSATTVLMTDHPSCSKIENQNFWVEFKTIKQPTNALKNRAGKPILISDFFTINDGDVLVPGVRRTGGYHRNDDTINGKLSCVKIIRSETP